jgi:hypothetical protein
MMADAKYIISTNVGILLRLQTKKKMITLFVRNQKSSDV